MKARRLSTHARALYSLLALCTVQLPIRGEGASCYPDLSSVLSYPTAALQGRIQGTVQMVFVFDAEGRATQFHSGGHPILAASVQMDLQQLPLVVDWVGRQTEITVIFEFNESLDPHSAIKVRRLSTDKYSVEAPFQTIEVTNYDPAWAFSRKGRALHRMRVWFSHLVGR